MFSARKVEKSEVTQGRLEKVYEMSRTNQIHYNVALVWACALNYLDAVKVLVHEHASIINSTNFFGAKTALMFAAANGHDEVVSFLLESGADPNLKDAGGLTALDKAANKGNGKCVNLLVNYHANVTAKSIALAEKKGHLEIAGKLRAARYNQVVENLAPKSFSQKLFKRFDSFKKESKIAFNPRHLFGL